MCQNCGDIPPSLFPDVTANELPAITPSRINSMPVDEDNDGQVECEDCGTMHDVEDSFDIDGEAYCGDCVTMCENCAAMHPASKENVTTCVSQHYPKKHQSLCKECSFECADCYDRFANSMGTWENASGDTVCERCGENYFCCEDCNGTIHSDDTNGDENFADGTFCSSCYETRRREYEEENGDSDEDSLLHDHDYKPKAVFHGQRKVYAGIEIECDSPRSLAIHEVLENIGFNEDDYYCKEDSSLNHGFEVVSHPRTWQSWCEHDFAWCDKVNKAGYRSYDTETCGMHVHVSRSFFTKLDLLKLLRFFEIEQEFILKMSRRRDKAALEEWSGVDINNKYPHTRKLKDGGEDRYSAINLKNSKTVEFRFFRGTLKVQSIRRNLALVFALAYYVKDTSLCNIRLTTFEQWVSQRASIFLGKIAAKSLRFWMNGFTIEQEA